MDDVNEVFKRLLCQPVSLINIKESFKTLASITNY